MIVREIAVPESAKSSGGKYLFSLSADGKGMKCCYWAKSIADRTELLRILEAAAEELADSIYEREVNAAKELRTNSNG